MPGNKEREGQEAREVRKAERLAQVTWAEVLRMPASLRVSVRNRGRDTGVLTSKHSWIHSRL